MNYQNIPSKSIAEIIRVNTFTFFNALNLCLGTAVFLTGEYKNMLFLGVIVANTAIGITQEIRAKRAIDRLSLISAAKAQVYRNEKLTEIAVESIIAGDIIILGEGRQIPADCEILTGETEVNESLLTGESDPVSKKTGDSLLSGSFVICGEATAIVRKVGEDSFAYGIMKGAKYLKKPSSKILYSVDRIIKIIAFIIIPIGLVLFLKSLLFTEDNFNDAVNTSVAALIGMIPQGLILLTSITMAVSVLRLSRRNALARDIYCAETLARVNVLCLDKTGTLTTGEMTVEKILPQGQADLPDVENILSALMQALPDKNPTATAIRNYIKQNAISCTWNVEKIMPFSSARKYSGAVFTRRGTYILCASDKNIENKRTLELKHDGNTVALITLNDIIRPEAKKALAFFAEQGVKIKIISGDNPQTVKNIAIAAGLQNAENCIDCIDMSSVNNADLSEIAEKYTIFGRVSPRMKLEIIKTLKKTNCVGMIGDGVNDVLPLKEADFSAAMQSGSEAARNVSSLVLLDNNFACLPEAVAEGRRSINNLERSAALFLTKTVYALILALIFLFPDMPYPFIPIQLTLINGLFIGLPSLFLALEKNNSLIRGDFLRNVMSKAFPYGLFTAFSVGVLVIFTNTSATIVLGIASFVILCKICNPINKKRLFLIVSSALLFMLATYFLGDFLFL